ncbi:uncharacterized protein MONBRDRAFT_31051 [Monosiga brevicollis MX1]|uniref:MATE efflux family protein n=1 Tax=Monosiga brevicollis TaxID=81824 RepID=A9UQZ9_MONBE|nr:uncharacterized protein MONBRDRAFT_31051 [Monosiga brevicollis MX1]EDQ93132.1 predicted protein [Monosiga brevicollis MX1]|eukprot:XP_001742894.1 hypothetical protein [Monosiga brevicollis MX1]
MSRHDENGSPGSVGDEQTPLLADAQKSRVPSTALDEGSIESQPGSQEGGQHLSLGAETRKILGLAMPIFVSVASFVSMKLVDTATLGHVGTEFLSASSLSDICTTSTGFLMQGNVLGTFIGQAWGAKNMRLVGIWFQLSLIIVGLFAIPVVITWNLTEYILRAFREHGEIVERAAYYSHVLSASVPATIFFNQRTKRYLALYLPAILLNGSEFWRFNTIGALAASLGDDELAAFNASYKIIYLSHQFAISVGIASSIRTGIYLGAGQAHDARRSSWLGTGIASSISFTLAVFVFFFPSTFGSIFTSDENVLAIFRDIRMYLAITVCLMSASDTMESIMLAQGRGRAVAIVSTVASWAVHVPASFLLVKYWRDNMEGLYLGVAIGYAFLTVICVVLLIRSKWDELVQDAQVRSEVAVDPDTVPRARDIQGNDEAFESET